MADPVGELLVRAKQRRRNALFKDNLDNWGAHVNSGTNHYVRKPLLYNTTDGSVGVLRKRNYRNRISSLFCSDVSKVSDLPRPGIHLPRGEYCPPLQRLVELGI